MTAFLRDCSPELAAALASGVRLWSADLFVVELVDGVSEYRWTNWDSDLQSAGKSYSSRKPWISRSSWSVTNSMTVPTMSVNLLSLNDGFAGGASLKSQIHQGLLDGAEVMLSRAYMTTPGDADALGQIDLFKGKVGSLDLDGITAALSIKGKVNDLDQYAPRNMIQVGCNHGFCDAGCTLLRADFTASFSVGTGASATFVPWASAPADPHLYQGGTLALSTGPAGGSRRTIATADSTGLLLSYPLYAMPSAGDAFTAFQGCDKSFDSGSGQSCSDRGNTQHYRGFEFTPPPNAAI